MTIMSKIVIRDMRKNDIAAISDIICACYRWLAQMEGYTAEETSNLIEKRGSCKALTKQQQECHFIAAEINDELTGAVSIRKNEIMKLYVDPNHFRRGIGSALFAYAENIIAIRGYDNILLGAFPSSAGFYEAMGMELENEKISAGGPIKGQRILAYGKKIRI
jgi:ribosomal protein S18 acetylase RimI-like enzyme